MASSRKWASTVSSIASYVFFVVIILQFPLFRVCCRGGICRAPLEVTCSQLMATELIPELAAKALLFPGAFVNGLFSSKASPNFLESLKLATQSLDHVVSDDLQHLEILAGSYLSVVGAFVGLVKPGRTSLFGTLLIIWGLSREKMLRKPAYVILDGGDRIYPAMSIALISALLSVRKDLRRIYRSCKSRSVTKPKLT